MNWYDLLLKTIDVKATLDREWVRNDYKILSIKNDLTWFIRLLGGDRLFQSASSWSKCCDWANAACSGFPMFCCEPILFISAILEISSMLVDTENRLLSRSSTWAIITDDVRWAYFFCHEYVSSDNSFLRSLLAGRFAAAGRKSVRGIQTVTVTFPVWKLCINDNIYPRHLLLAQSRLAI